MEERIEMLETLDGVLVIVLNEELRSGEDGTSR